MNRFTWTLPYFLFFLFLPQKALPNGHFDIKNTKLLIFNNCLTKLVIKGTIFSDTNRIEQSICPEDSLWVYDTWFHAANPSGAIVIPGASADGTDSLIEVTLTFFPEAKGSYRDTFCSSQFVLLFGQLFSPDQPSADIPYLGQSQHGCDSVLEVRLQFAQATEHQIEGTICPGDTLWVNGNAYHYTYYIGTEILENANSSGCDSLVEIDLTPGQEQFFSFQQTLYDDENLQLHGEQFDKNRPEGNVILPLMASTGCDSIIEVRLNFRPRPEKFAYLPNIWNTSEQDTYEPNLTPEVERLLYMRIYDRWGSLVFSTENPVKSSWDGSNNGKLAGTGVFLVEIELLLKDGRQIKEAESVLLLR